MNIYKVENEVYATTFFVADSFVEVDKMMRENHAESVYESVNSIKIIGHIQEDNIKGISNE